MGNDSAMGTWWKTKEKYQQEEYNEEEESKEQEEGSDSVRGPQRRRKTSIQPFIILGLPRRADRPSRGTTTSWRRRNFAYVLLAPEANLHARIKCWPCRAAGNTEGEVLRGL